MGVVLVAPALKKYHAPILSRATLLFVLFLLLIFGLPFLLAYAAQSFWLKQNSYIEQPKIHFTHELVFTMQGKNQAGPLSLAWARDTNFNRLLGDQLRIPIVKIQEVDQNHDGIMDYLTYNITVPLQPGEDIYSVNLALFFQYQLKDHISVSMQSMALISHESALPGSELHVTGDLRIRQQSLIPWTSAFLVFTTPIVDWKSFIIAPNANLPRNTRAFHWNSLVDAYSARNVTTYVDGAYPMWTPNRDPMQPFSFTGRLYYADDTIAYRPGVLEILKNGWMQYLTVAVLFAAVFLPFYNMLVKNQIVATHIDYGRAKGGSGLHKDKLMNFQF